MPITNDSYFANEYTFSIAGAGSNYEEYHAVISENAVGVVEYLSNYVYWKGSLDFVVKFVEPSGSGLLPAFGGIASDGKTLAQSEALSGTDANGSSPDLGAHIIPNSNGSLTNYGTPLYFQEAIDPYTNQGVANGHHDFFSIYLHEVLHGLGFWSTAQHEGFGKTSFDQLTEERNGQYFFTGQNTKDLLGVDLPLATTGSRDHYGTLANGGGPVDRGAVFEYGNYSQNRWHLGKLELAVLEDLGYRTANSDKLALVEQPDGNFSDPRIKTSNVSGQSFAGSIGSETMRATWGDDTVTGAGGNDTIDGREGVDTAKYAGEASHFGVTITKGGATTVLDRKGTEGTDSLTNVENLDFSGNKDVNLDILDGVVNVSSTDLLAFIEMYIAYFNRAPDAEGLFYWGTRLSEGMGKEQIAKSFYVQPETQALYTNPDDTEGFVTAVYNNFLGRAPDAEGFAYWVSELNSGSVSKPIFLLAIINGAKAATGSQTDVDYFTNKANIGAYYSVIKGMSNTDNAKAAMALYDGSAASITAAKNQIDTYYNAALDANNGELLINLVGVMDDPFAA